MKVYYGIIMYLYLTRKRFQKIKFNNFKSKNLIIIIY
jgi:hypothetical protein